MAIPLTLDAGGAISVNLSGVRSGTWRGEMAIVVGSMAIELIALYGLNRHANLQLLRRLKPEDLKKSAFHPELKKDVTVADLVEKMSEHGASHLAQIEKLKKEAGKQHVI